MEGSENNSEVGRSDKMVEHVYKDLPELPQNPEQLRSLIAKVQRDTLSALEGGLGNILSIKAGYQELVENGRAIPEELLKEVAAEQDARLLSFKESLSMARKLLQTGPIDIAENAQEHSYLTIRPIQFTSEEHS